MTIRNFDTIFICALFAIFLFTGCASKEREEPGSREKDIHQVYEKVVKDRNKTLKAAQKREEDESKRGKR